jgi:uncharacterized protein
MRRRARKAMRYNVSSLMKAPLGAQMTLTVEEGQRILGGDLEVEYLRGTVRLTRTTQRLLARAHIRTEIAAECVRCLEPFRLPLDIRFEELFTLFPSRPADKTYHVGEDSFLNLEPPLREQVQLATPMQTLCRPDCRGLCSQCGQNLNEGACNCSDTTDDPRLAALGTLLP